MSAVFTGNYFVARTLPSSKRSRVGVGINRSVRGEV